MSGLSRTKILIIGSGISGLLLAQILRKADIDFEIFERDDGTRSQGWSVGLDKCLLYLEGLLPDDIEPFSAASPLPELEKDGFAIMDGLSHKVLGTALSKSDEGLFVSRNKLRKILGKHIDIQYNKQLLKYDEDGGVTAYFNDGTQVRGTMLVGADGAKSAVRGQLLPDFHATESRYTMIHGNVVLSKEVFGPILENSSLGILASQPDLQFYLLLEGYLKEDALFSWNCSWKADDSDADHVWSQNASQESLFQRVLEMLQHYPGYIRRAIESTGPSGIQKPPIKLLETVLPEMPGGLVTLVGDAAHSMAPFRGMGANTAVIDACELGRAILEGIGEILCRRFADMRK